MAYLACFSPLLDGDGVASRRAGQSRDSRTIRFQSPSRWGRCCIAQADPRVTRQSSLFQSPSRWGRCCIPTFQVATDGNSQRFSPLLDGDGVASHCLADWRTADPHRFSPLLDGDGVASAGEMVPDAATATDVSVPFSMGTVLHQSIEGVGARRIHSFQSPSRWGRCCIADAVTGSERTAIVSVPFSMGTVLHRTTLSCQWLGWSSFQSPSRWGRCCISQDAADSPH